MPTSQCELRPFGSTGLKVSPLGLSASYYPGKHAVDVALESGINLFQAFGIDVQMIRGLRPHMGTNRDKIVLATGAYNYIWWAQNIRKAFEKRLRLFRTDHIDIFLFMGVMKPEEFPRRVLDDMVKLRDEGKVRAIGLSCHDRKFLGKLAADGAVDALMLRYNAAHRGAEQDIFPHLARHDPGIISYTATRWTYLLRRPKGWPKDGRIPTAGETYRFVLSNPHVHCALTAPRSIKQLRENIEAVRLGPLDADDMKFMRTFGDSVYFQKKYFM